MTSLDKESNDKLWDALNSLAETARALVERAADYSRALQDIGAARPQESEVYRLICGDFRDEHDRTNEQPLFWLSVRLATVSQFGGLAVPRHQRGQVEELLKFTTTGDDFTASFWSPAEVNKDPDRACFLWSLVNAVFRWPKAFTERSLQPAKLVRTVDARFAALRQSQAGWSRENLQRAELSKLRGLALARLNDDELQSIGKSVTDGYLGDLADVDDRLFQELERLLGQSKHSPDLRNLALLLRILASRFLNPDLHLTRVRLRSVERAAKRLLKLQRQGFRGMGDHELLLVLLELPDEVLVRLAKPLVSSAKDVCDQLERSLDSLEPIDQFHTERQEDGLTQPFNILRIALSLGALAYDRFRDLLSNSILIDLGAVPAKSEMTWEDVQESLWFRESLEEGVISEWVSGSDTRPGSILVFGPPGTGKTSIGKLIAARLREQLKKRSPQLASWQFLEFRPADFARHGSDRIVSTAESVFAKLRRVRRCVVLMDEMEEFIRARSEDGDKTSRLVTTALLPLLQDVVERREIILVVATNFVRSIDAAMLRQGRFDLILPLGPPGPEGRENLIKKMMGEVENERLERLVTYTMGYSHSEILQVLRDPRFRSVNCANESGIAELEILLWQMRAEQVPMALSGRGGCDWPTFQDEASRFARYPLKRVATGSVGEERTRVEDEDYWREPELPLPRIRALSRSH